MMKSKQERDDLQWRRVTHFTDALADRRATGEPMDSDQSGPCDKCHVSNGKNRQPYDSNGEWYAFCFNQYRDLC